MCRNLSQTRRIQLIRMAHFIWGSVEMATLMKSAIGHWREWNVIYRFSFFSAAFMRTMPTAFSLGAAQKVCDGRRCANLLFVFVIWHFEWSAAVVYCVWNSQYEFHATTNWNEYERNASEMCYLIMISSMWRLFVKWYCARVMKSNGLTLMTPHQQISILANRPTSHEWNVCICLWNRAKIDNK